MDNQSPLVYRAPETEIKQKPWFKTWRLVYPVFAIVLLVEIIVGLKTILTPLPKAAHKKIQPITLASMQLISAKKEVNVGEIIPVKIGIWTGGNITSGTDLIMRFDPKVLEVGPANFIKGKIYDDYPIINIDNKEGLIRISGITAIGKRGFGGIGEFGEVSFKSISKGKTAITIDFKANSTDDTNVTSSLDSKDVLGGVSNLNLTVK